MTTPEPTEPLTPKFKLGATMMSAGFANSAKEDSILLAWSQLVLARHANGDWGDVDAEDRAMNDAAVAEGERIVSSYTLPDEFEGCPSDRLWVITERDRSVTTILWPSDY